MNSSDNCNNLRRQFEQLLTKFDEVDLAGFSGYSGRKLLFLQSLMYLQADGLSNSVQTSLTPFIGNAFSYSVKRGGGEIIAYCSPRYHKRLDMQRMFDNICSCMDSPSTLVGIRKIEVRPAHAANVALIPFWRKALRDAGVDVRLIKYLIPFLAKARNVLSFLEENRCLFDDKRLMVTLFDQDYDEYLVTEFCRNLGIKTAVMQHGHFSGQNDNRDLFSLPYPYENLNADYFLAWGDISKDRAVSCGVLEEKILTLGNPKHIGIAKRVDLHSQEMAHKNCFAVMLEADLYETQKTLNRQMIALANRLCSDYGLTCLVKPHPGDDFGSLSMGTGGNSNISLMSAGSDPALLADMADFFICAQSSAYAELLCLGKAVLRYVPDKSQDKYAEIETGVFSNYATLEEKYRQMRCDEANFFAALAKNAQALCSDGDVRDRYRRGFDWLIRR